MSRPFVQTIAALITGTVLLPLPAAAYETDQFYNRSEPIADSTEVLNRKVNETIADIASDWNGGENRRAFVYRIYRRLGGRHWVDKLERWAMKSPDVDKLETPRYDSIYSGLPLWSTRTVFVFGIGKTIRINDQLIGSDKIGHFLSQGRKFYKRYLRYGSEEKAARRSIFTERSIFGSPTTGSFSNADLVANYEGYRFYRSLFEDDVIPGKEAILRWEDGNWVVQRDFDWADHVNEYWDEALNVNDFDWLLYRHMRRKFIALCPEYWENPALYEIENEGHLRSRYSHIGLHDSRFLRLDNLCLSAGSKDRESVASADEMKAAARHYPSAGGYSSKP